MGPAAEMTSAVISLTTLPSRINHLGRCVESLVAQGPPVYIWLPRYVERTGGGFNDVPGFLRELDVHVEIVEDQGPATKLLPALERFATVITADDDSIFGDGWARGLLEWAEKRPDAALGYRGRRFGKELRYNRSQQVRSRKQARPVHLIASVDGTLYHRHHFDDSIFKEWKEWPLNDDIVICGHLWRRGVPMLVIPRHCTIRATQAHEINELWQQNRYGLNDKALKLFYRGWDKK